MLKQCIALSSSEGQFFNKSSASTWEQAVPFSLLILSFIPTRHSIYQRQKKYRAFNLTLRYIDDVLIINVQALLSDSINKNVDI